MTTTTRDAAPAPGELEERPEVELPTTAEIEALTPAQMAEALRETREELRLARLKLKGIQEIGQILAKDHNLDRVLAEIIKRTTALMAADRATLFLLADDGETMWSKSTHGGEIKTIELQVGQGIAGWVARYGRPVNVKDAYKDPRFDQEVDRASGYRTRSILCQPLRDSKGRTLGVIQVLNKADEGYFTTADEGLLSAIAGQAAVCIHNSRLYLDLVTKNIDLLDTGLKLKDRTKEIELMFRVERRAATARVLSDALGGALECLYEEYPAEGAAIYLFEERAEGLRFFTGLGDAAAWLDGGAVVPIPGSLIGDAYASGDAVMARATDQAQRERLGAAPPAGWVMHNAVAVPIGSSTPLGVLFVVNRARDPRGFDERDTKILKLIASRMGLSVELARALEEERKAERLAAIGKMMSGVVHDLKTPLTIIGGYARLMAKEDDQEARQRHRELLKGQIAAIQAMTQELLAFARGETQILLRRVYVKDFVNEIRELLEQELASSDVALVVDMPYSGAVKMDEDKMKRAVFNLARNAREAMSEQGGGTFRLAVEEREGRVLFSFSDTGPGIPKQMEGRLFDSFATHGKKHGTGLGLAIVKKIVDEHEGTLEVVSAQGVGTTFTIGLAAQ